MEELQKMLNEVKCLKIDYNYDIGIDFEKAQAEIDRALQLLQTDVIESVCDNCERKKLYIKKQCYCGYCGDRLKT